MADKDDATGGRDGCFNDANNVRDGQAVEKGPHGKVLESGRGRGELVAQSIILHVDADKVIQSRSREAQNTRNLFSMEQVSSLVPVNPHATQVVAQEIVQRVARQERQTIRNPVCLLGVVIVVVFGPLPQVTDGLGPLLVGPRPDAQADAIERVRRVLLEDERVVSAVGLVPASTDFDIVREASLLKSKSAAHTKTHHSPSNNIKRTLIEACRARAISLSCSRRGLLPRISGSQNCPTAPFMWVILPWAGVGALTH